MSYNHDPKTCPACQNLENEKPPPPLAAPTGSDAAFEKWWQKWGVQYVTTRAAAEQAFLAGVDEGIKRNEREAREWMHGEVVKQMGEHAPGTCHHCDDKRERHLNDEAERQK